MAPYFTSMKQKKGSRCDHQLDKITFLTYCAKFQSSKIVQLNPDSTYSLLNMYFTLFKVNMLFCKRCTTILKPGQNKKGQKNFQLHCFFNSILQLVAEKKYSKNGAAGIFFVPSYFATALVMQYNHSKSFYGVNVLKCLQTLAVIIG